MFQLVHFVIPELAKFKRNAFENEASSGIHLCDDIVFGKARWIPAFAGMTLEGVC